MQASATGIPTQANWNICSGGRPASMIEEKPLTTRLVEVPTSVVMPRMEGGSGISSFEAGGVGVAR